MNRLPFVIAACATLLAPASLVSGQEADGAAPVLVSGARLHTPGGLSPNRLEFRSVNVSQRPIVATAYRIKVRDTSKKLVWLGTMSILSKEIAGGSRRGPVVPGESSMVTMNLPNDSSIRSDSVIEIDIDFVRFLDGSTWGPDKSKQAEFIEGLRIKNAQ